MAGFLTLLADSLIGVRLAEAATLPGPPTWVMLTHLLGQLLWSLATAASVAAGQAEIVTALGLASAHPGQRSAHGNFLEIDVSEPTE